MSSPEAPQRNLHGFMAFGISSTALLVGTAGIGVASVIPHLRLSPVLQQAINLLAYALPLALSSWGFFHGVKAFVLARRGIPCHKESDFAAFLGLLIATVVAGLFLWFGLVRRA